MKREGEKAGKISKREERKMKKYGKKKNVKERKEEREYLFKNKEKVCRNIH